MLKLDNKEKAGFFVGGAFSDDVRVDEDLIVSLIVDFRY